MAKTILEALNELVEKQGGNTEDNKLIVDALNDLVNTSGGGSSGGAGYEKEETKVFWVDEQTITVTNTAEAGQDPYYTVSNYTNNEEVLNGLEIGTEGTCVIDGTEYKAVWSQEYVGYVKKYISVYDGETEILQLGLGGWITNNGFFTAEGTHTISVYYFAEALIVSEDFKEAVMQTSNILYLGSSFEEFMDTTITAGSYDAVSFGADGPQKANYASLRFCFGIANNVRYQLEYDNGLNRILTDEEVRVINVNVVNANNVDIAAIHYVVDFYYISGMEEE